ncbi:MAG: hypothetical protein J5824_09450 [Lachnospiraceae bacterium]|nr:hypothetical protein [Lachnospiraceae bacterium]
MKRVYSLAVVTVMILIFSFISGPVLRADAAEGLCTYISGDNANDQNYSVSASVVDSYLHSCDDGSIMQVQFCSADGYNTVITYYSESFDIISQKKLSTELPLAGGFYALDGHYYLLSGQSNKEEDNSKAVFALTKYDAGWKKEGTAYIYGANTVTPFSAGSARFASIGKYIYIRTCHIMYTTEDGLNHQANVTFSVDTENMTVLYSNTGITNSYNGYSSHSFNQFIGIDGNTLFAADHGDAYPRSLVLFVYENDCSGGIPGSSGYWGSSTTPVDMLAIPGSIGANTTKASLGGLECSSTDYIIAGNSVDMSNYNTSTVRNIFTASVSKSTYETDTPKLTYITGYTDNSRQVSTPFLVNTGSDRFILMWFENDGSYRVIDDKGTAGGAVYYTELNGRGEQVGRIYSMEACLSDCKPILRNGKLLWYVWNNAVTVFYEINTSNLSDTSSVIVYSGHDYQFAELSKKGDELKEVCSKCGESRTSKVPTRLSLYLSKFSIDEYGYHLYSRVSGTEFTEGETLGIEMAADAGEFMPVIEVSDPGIVEITQDDWWDEFLQVRLLAPGSCTITVSQKYNDKTAQSLTITVLGEEFTVGTNRFRILDKKGKKAVYLGSTDKSLKTLKIPTYA